MHVTTKVGIGCGCVPAALLALAAVVCFVLVGAGAINYSEENTVMIVGAVLLVLGLFCAAIGAVTTSTADSAMTSVRKSMRIVLKELISCTRPPPRPRESGGRSAPFR